MELSIFLLWCFFAAMGGILISILLDINSSGIKWDEFIFRKWWNENGFRIITGVFCIAFAILFSDAIWPVLIGAPITIQQAILAGLSSDQIINSFQRRRKNKDAKAENETPSVA